MTIRKILVPLVGRYDAEELKQVSEATLRAGLSLGRDLAAHVEVCCFAAAWHDPHEQLSAGIPGAAVQEFLSAIDKRNEESFYFARTLFDRLSEEFGPKRMAEPDGEAVFSAAFLEVVGELSEFASQRGKVADLTVMAAKPEDGHGSYHQMLQALLTDTGRPLLIFPGDPKPLTLEKVAVAWNGTAEAARAIALAQDVLTKSSRAAIITVLEDGGPPAGAKELADYLLWHGIESELVEAEGSGRQVPDLLMEQALQAEADLLVMGAYTRSTLRRVVFGGATGGVLARPALPIFMVD